MHVSFAHQNGNQDAIQDVRRVDHKSLSLNPAADRQQACHSERVHLGPDWEAEEEQVFGQAADLLALHCPPLADEVE